MGDVCRICHCEAEVEAPLISPCVCAGSLKYVHQACLQQWIKSADTKSCEVCKHDFQMTTHIKPFRKVSTQVSPLCRYIIMIPYPGAYTLSSGQRYNIPLFASKVILKYVVTQCKTWLAITLTPHLYLYLTGNALQ